MYMKKIIKILLSLTIGIILLLAIDLICIYTINKYNITCSPNYNYYFNESSSVVNSCSTGSSFTCNSSNYGSSYVASCTPNYSYSFNTATANVSKAYFSPLISTILV